MIETAERLFAVQGYAGTSIRDIAREGSVNSAMIYHYFGSKELLMEAILEYRTSNVARFLDQVLNQELTPSEKISQLVELYIDRATTHKYYYALLIQVQLLSRDSKITQYFNTLRERNFRLLQTIVRAGQKKGVFQPDVDLTLLISTLAGTINHYVLNLNYFRSMHKSQEMTEEAYLVLVKKQLSTYLGSLLDKTLLVQPLPSEDRS
nr:TetR family transcriptional regulator [Pontibacter liquoris]